MLALALLPTLVLLAWVPSRLRASAEQHADAIRGQLGELSADAVDLVQGLREVVLFGGQGARASRLDSRAAALGAVKVAHSRRAGLEHAVTDGLTALGIAIVLCVCAWLVAQGRVPSAQFPVAVILAATSLQPVAAVLDVVRDLNLAGAAAQRVSQLLAAALEAPAPADASETCALERPLTLPIQFEHVGYRYAPERPWALSDVSFELRPGETVALVGHSGAGKSTLASLLLRLWDATQGAVRIGGVDVKQLPLAELRRLVTAVPQDVYLFNTTLRENIRLGAPDADDRSVEAAARAALAHDFICELPEGYDSRVGELGARLSGGQRQRIAIARALLRDAPILVLDEAVSSLDSVGEQAIARAIAQLRQGRTSLVIAHRLSSIVSADRLLVLEHGKLVEQGTHAELAGRDGPYARLIASQLTADA
jgi:ABC-type multidrug transport system fused ATPase/permease subunit